MKRKYIVGFSILFVVVLAQVYGFFKHKGQNNDIYSQLQTVPGFERKAVEGHYFILHFWAKWCAPCAEEIPHLVNFASIAQEKLPDLKFVAVSLDESLEISKSILPNQGVGLPTNFMLLLDHEHALAEMLGSYQYPETYFFDPKGKVMEKWVGAQKWDKGEVMEYFKGKVLVGR